MVIGFQRGSVSVNEPDGEVPVTITILNGVSLARNVNVQLISEDGSARQGTIFTIIIGVYILYTSLTLQQEMTILKSIET